MAVGDTGAVRERLLAWLSHYSEPLEIWADCLAYDWVLFCELFGGALSLPQNLFYVPNDLATVLRVAGLDPDLERVAFAGIEPGAGERHNALFDARVLRACVERLAQSDG